MVVESSIGPCVLGISDLYEAWEASILSRVEVMLFLLLQILRGFRDIQIFLYGDRI
jgi:hypothetical protein